MSKIFIIKLTMVVDRATYEPHLPAHLAYLRELKQRGHLVLSGPFGDRTGGIVLIQAETDEDARAIAQADPLVSSGVDAYELHEWQITDGVLENITFQRL